MAEDADVLIIGGGPGGSTAATILARQGRRVVVLEKERFPRFHIGESLLPYNRRLFAELGVLPRLEAAGFLRKSGAQFHAANGSQMAQFVFRHGCFTRETTAFQVERAPFDELLLRHAQASGADVREGWTVERFARAADGIRVTAGDPEGQSQELTGRFLIDASGRGNVTGNQEGLREMHPRHRKLAIYSHFRGVERDAGERGGDTVIVRLPHKWFWLIPLSPDKVSVGCVIDKDEFARDGRPAAEVFESLVQASAVMQKRLARAEALRPLEVTTDFSYSNRQLAAGRVIRVGDAAGFMDPIFSAGVYLAMFTGREAARVIGDALDHGDDGGAAMARYERRVRRSLQTYWRMVEAFYTQPFMELFFSPTERFRLTSAVNAILAGELEGGWRLTWRLRVFFLLVKLQGRFSLVPRAELG
jgi:FADH2-dependent halogenase